MLTMHKFERLRTLIDAGLNNSEIARRLKVDRSTVRKYRASNTSPSYKDRQTPTREDPVKSFDQAIAQWVHARGDISATSVFLFIKEQGYTGSLRSVERRVAALKAGKPKERFFEQSYTPGEQSQFDFKEKLTITFKVPRLCAPHSISMPS